MSHGCFITLEGIEGVGKSSAVACVVDWLSAQGRTVMSTREPGGTALGEQLRQVLLARDGVPIAPLAELLLMFAGRAQHLAERIRPALARGETVVCDRFTDATFAYQGGGRGLPAADIAAAARLVHGDLAPDLTLLLDAPPALGLGRVLERGAADRFETEQVEFFTRVRDAYLELAAREPARFVVIDASQPLETVHASIRAALAARLP
ncbi:MAG: dTMP kinase [Gammaproteobacteria bacterium]|nr:dTMP kinase [Gammaproteobacteria bacterium]